MGLRTAFLPDGLGSQAVWGAHTDGVEGVSVAGREAEWLPEGYLGWGCGPDIEAWVRTKEQGLENTAQGPFKRSV